MVASHLVWLLRTREMRRRAKDAGETFDEFEETAEWQARGIDVEKKLRLTFFKKSTERGKEHADADGAKTVVDSEDIIPKTVPNAVV